MRLQTAFCQLCVLASLGTSIAKPQDLTDRINSAEAGNSQLPQIMHKLADTYGPRLTGSPNDRAAAEWAVRAMQGWSLSNAHLEHWNFGHAGWVNDVANGQVLVPIREQLYLKALAWTPSTSGTVTADVILIDPPKDTTAASLEGYFASVGQRVRGKIVLVGSGVMVPGMYTPHSPRLDEKTVRDFLTPKDVPPSAPSTGDKTLTTAEWEHRVNRFLLSNGALVRINDSQLPNREIRVQGNRDLEVSDAPPTAVLSNEDFSRIARLQEDGQAVQLAIRIENHAYVPGAEEQNVVAEIPGTDRGEEVVLLGAHLDSWHGATGATDNGIGCAIMMEAMRVLQDLHLKPRRTIRIALFTGEEQGLLGSQAYVSRHFGTAEDRRAEFNDLDAYLNIDSGSGRIRTVNVFGPPEDAAILRDLLAPLKSIGVEGAVAHRVRKLRSTDATTFSRAGLPAIGLTQDPLDYQDVTWHTNLDDMNHVNFSEARLAVEAVAVLAFELANDDRSLPRFGRGDMPKPEGPPPAALPLKSKSQ